MSCFSQQYYCPPKANDLFHVISLPIPPHATLTPVPGFLAPKQEEIPGACLVKSFSVPLKP